MNKNKPDDEEAAGGIRPVTDSGFDEEGQVNEVCNCVLIITSYETDFTGQRKSFDTLNYYRLQTKLREGNVVTPVCHSVHRGEGISLTETAWRVTPWIETPPDIDPLDRDLLDRDPPEW